MRFSWWKQKRMEAQVKIPSISGGDTMNSSGLMTGVEKGFFEVFLFTFSMILHLLHSLEGEHGAKS